MCPIAPNALWALDFQFDHTIDHRQVKMLNVIDEFTRECLAIVVDHSIDADDVVAVLDRLAVERGRAPAFVRFDNGPSSSSTSSPTGAGSTAPSACSSTPARRGRTPGSSRSTAASATSCSTCWQFDSLLEAQVLIGDWRIDYNINRPHTAHGDLTPTEFAQAWTTNTPPTQRRIAAGPLIGALPSPSPWSLASSGCPGGRRWTRCATTPAPGRRT